MMKKMMWMAIAFMAASAGAQSWDTNSGTLKLNGCSAKQDGVYCDFSFTLTKKQTASIGWLAGSFKVFKQDGTSQNSDKVSGVAPA